MAREIYRKIIELVLKASDLARSIGISNLLQPGLVKEMIIADILGHELIHSKRDADARAPNNPAEKYEYLSCKEDGSEQRPLLGRVVAVGGPHWLVGDGVGCARGSAAQLTVGVRPGHGNRDCVVRPSSIL